MRIEHPGIDHTWACRQIEGSLGEIRNFTTLSAPQIETITADPARMEDVCPGGEVVCDACEVPFGVQAQPVGAAVPTGEPGIDFKALKADLVAPAPVASGKQTS